MSTFDKTAAAKALARKFAANALRKIAGGDGVPSNTSSWSDLATKAKNSLYDLATKPHPLSYGLGGAALGGAAGILGEHFGGREDDEKDYLSRALTGSVIGGTIGAGGAAFHNALGTDLEANKDQADRANSPQFGVDPANSEQVNLERAKKTIAVADGEEMPEGSQLNWWGDKALNGFATPFAWGEQQLGLSGQTGALVGGMFGGMGLGGAAIGQGAANLAAGHGLMRASTNPGGNRLVGYKTLGDSLQGLRDSWAGKNPQNVSDLEKYVSKLSPDKLKALGFSVQPDGKLNMGSWSVRSNMARLDRESNQLRKAVSSVGPETVPGQTVKGTNLIGQLQKAFGLSTGGEVDPLKAFSDNLGLPSTDPKKVLKALREKARVARSQASSAESDLAFSEMDRSMVKAPNTQAARASHAAENTEILRLEQEIAAAKSKAESDAAAAQTDPTRQKAYTDNLEKVRLAEARLDTLKRRIEASVSKVQSDPKLQTEFDQHAAKRRTIEATLAKMQTELEKTNAKAKAQAQKAGLPVPPKVELATKRNYVKLQEDLLKHKQEMERITAKMQTVKGLSANKRMASSPNYTKAQSELAKHKQETDRLSAEIEQAKKIAPDKQLAADPTYVAKQQELLARKQKMEQLQAALKASESEEAAAGNDVKAKTEAAAKAKQQAEEARSTRANAIREVRSRGPANPNAAVAAALSAGEHGHQSTVHSDPRLAPHIGGIRSRMANSLTRNVPVMQNIPGLRSIGPGAALGAVMGSLGANFGDPKSRPVALAMQQTSAGKATKRDEAYFAKLREAMAQEKAQAEEQGQ